MLQEIIIVQLGESALHGEGTPGRRMREDNIHHWLELVLAQCHSAATTIQRLHCRRATLAIEQCD